jgi:hypothetical protein
MSAVGTKALVSAVAIACLCGAAGAADLPVPTSDPIPAAPADLPLPAVSALNGKFAVLGGGLDAGGNDGELFGAQGSISVPIGQRFGFQADGFGALASGDWVAGGAGHFFWRDPSIGLLGAYGGGARNDLLDFYSVRAGIEGEAYLGRFAVEALLGWEGLDFDAGGGDDNIFALADLAFYVTDDLRFSAGYRHWSDTHMAAFGAEYQLPMQWGGSSAALFAEGRVGENDYYAVWGGLRVYLGAEPKSLIRRHREDDPHVRMEDQAGPTPPTASSPLCPPGYVYVPPDGEVYLEGHCEPENPEIPEGEQT